MMIKTRSRWWSSPASDDKSAGLPSTLDLHVEIKTRPAWLQLVCSSLCHIGRMQIAASLRPRDSWSPFTFWGGTSVHLNLSEGRLTRPVRSSDSQVQRISNLRQLQDLWRSAAESWWWINMLCNAAIKDTFKKGICTLSGHFFLLPCGSFRGRSSWLARCRMWPSGSGHAHPCGRRTPSSWRLCKWTIEEI